MRLWCTTTCSTVLEYNQLLGWFCCSRMVWGARNHKEIHEVARPQLVELDRDASIPRHAVSSGVTLVQDEVASTPPQRAP